jgi:hypothetical protein
MNESQHIRLRQLSAMRGIRRAHSIRKKLNIRRNNIRKDKRPKKYEANQYARTTCPKKPIKLIEDFRLLYNTENVIRQINQAADYAKRDGGYSIHFDISTVQKIDIGAIGLLLTVANTLSRSNCLVYGNVPTNEECKQLFFESGFLDHVRLIQGEKPKRNGNNLMIIERGFDKTSNARFGIEVRKAVKHLTGIEESYRPVYGIIQEICANSIEHANQESHQKNWLLTTYYAEDRVVFTMTDIGRGILGTLRKKIPQTMRDCFTDNVSILDGVFDKKYQSSTFDSNRNKGLPKIKETNKNNYIENLKVITNNVFLDFNEKSGSRNLSTRLRGTFYYWELTKNAILKWKQRTN